MDTLERGISGRRMVLFLSAGKAFAEKEICFAVGENYTLQIPAEELHLTESFFLFLRQKEEGVLEMNGKIAGEEAWALENGFSCQGDNVYILAEIIIMKWYIAAFLE